MGRRPKVIDAEFSVVSGPRQSMAAPFIAWAVTMAVLMAPLAAYDYWYVGFPEWVFRACSTLGVGATWVLIQRWKDVRPGYDYRLLFRVGRLIRSASKLLNGPRRAHKLNQSRIARQDVG